MDLFIHTRSNHMMMRLRMGAGEANCGTCGSHVCMNQWNLYSCPFSAKNSLGFGQKEIIYRECGSLMKNLFASSSKI